MGRLETEVPTQRPPTSPVSQEEWDRLIAAGIRPPTHSIRRMRPAVPQRPRWLAFLIRRYEALTGREWE